MPMAPEAMTTAERIRYAALEGFARDGVAATSIRKVAAAARVSPGLVQHYYPTKAALRQAVDAYVLQVTAATYGDLPGEGTGQEVADEISRRIAWGMRHIPLGLRYLARGIIDGDRQALELFDGFVEIARGISREDIRAGRAAPDIDPVWAPLHVVVYNMGVILLEQAINRQLPEPLHSDAGLERWRVATTALFHHGLYRPEHEP